VFIASPFGCLAIHVGIVGLSNSLKLWHLGVDDSQGQLNELASRLPLVSMPRAMAVNRPYSSRTLASVQAVQVTIGLIEQPGCLQVALNSSIRALVPSFQATPSIVLTAHPFKDLLISFGTDESVIVVTSDWSQLIYSLNVQLELSPDAPVRIPRVDWCLSGPSLALALSWPRTPWSIQRRRQTQCAGVLVCTLSENNNDPVARFAIQSEFIATVCEIDGLRIMGANDAYLLRFCPVVLQALTQLGSTTPGALMVESLRALDARDATAHDLLNIIEDKPMAVSELISACTHELDVKQAVEWLRAAALAGHGGNDLTSAGLNMRVVAAMAKRGAAVTTAYQIAMTSREVCFSRLVKTGGDFFLAHKVAKWWSLSSRPVLATWACAQAALNGEFETIRARLLVGGKTSSGAAAAVAMVAWRAGKKDLALRLVALEVRIDRRVMALLQMSEATKAMEILEASSGVDPDLVNRVAAFAKMENHPAAIRIAINPCERLAQIGTKPAFHQRALLLVEMALSNRDGEYRLALLEDAAKAFESAGRADRAVQAREHAKLLALQQNVSPRLVGKSACESIVDCVARKQEDLVEKFRLGVSPMLYWRARLRGLAMRGGWPEALKLASAKESNRYVSLNDVAEICIDNGAFSVAAQVAFDMPMDDARALILCKLKMFKEALQAAKSRDSLALIIAQCGDDAILDAARVKLSEQQADIGSNLLFIPGLETLRGVVQAPRRCETQ